MARKAAVGDHNFLVSEDHTVFVSQRSRRTFDQVDETLTSRPDVSTVLDIVGRPKSLGGLIVPHIQKCVESFEDKCLVRFFNVFVISGAPVSSPYLNNP
jgi:hypothetical protein